MKLTRRDWVLANGQSVDFDWAVALMDRRLRAELQTELAPCSAQSFIDAYLVAHRVKFGEDFDIVTVRHR